MKIETKELGVVKVQVTKAGDAANQLVVKVKEDMPVAVDLLARIKKVGGLVKEKKEGITKPLNEALKNARELFRPIEDALINAEGVVKTKMLEFNSSEEKRLKEEQEAIAKKVEGGKMKFDTAVKKMEALEPVEITHQSKAGEVQFRIVKKVVIEKPELVPAKYLMNEKVVDALRAAVREDALAGVVIPGVKVVEEKTVAGYQK